MPASGWPPPKKRSTGSAKSLVFAANIGFHMAISSPDRIREINPWLTTDGVLAGAYTTMDGHVDAASACNAMAAGARQMGTTILRHNRVTGINRLASGGFDVVTEQGNVTCEHVVNAGGCYAPEVNAWLGVETPIINMVHQYLVTEPRIAGDARPGHGRVLSAGTKGRSGRHLQASRRQSGLGGTWRQPGMAKQE